MLTVSIATRVRPPGATRGREVNAWRDEHGTVFARGFASGTTFGVEWSGLGYFEFRVGSATVDAWLDSPADVDRARDAVGRVLQPMMLQALGWQALHASGNVVGSGVVALCGRSGQGKSTLAYALARAGAPQFADDAVVLGFDEPAIRATPLPFRPRLRATSRAHFGTPEQPAGASPAPLRLVVVLEQDRQAGPPELRPIPQVEAFSTLVTHAHCFDPSPGPASERLVRDMMRLAGDVPVRRLRYRPDLDHLDATARLVIHAATELSPDRRGTLGIVR